MSCHVSRRKLIKVAANAIEEWRIRIECWPRTLVWTLAGSAVGLGVAFPAVASEIVRTLPVMHHLQLVGPALIRTQPVLWPASPPLWYHPVMMSDGSWWRAVLANATIFAGLAAISAELTSKNYN